ncbi:MAG: hypothetical protein U9R53_04870 [Chloroflexota bacterium]|nr:hypothetical protein [Chloroflexota bacterium]
MMNLEKIKALLTDFRISIPVGVVLGLILGLVIGWGIWPVQWTDLAPYHLRQDLREDYLRMTIFTTTSNGDGSIASKAWSELEDTAEETLDAVREDPKYLKPDQIASFMAIVGAGVPEATPTIALSEVLEEETEGGGPKWLLLGGLCLGLILIAGVVFYLLVIRTRSSKEDKTESLGSEDVSRIKDIFGRDDMAVLADIHEEPAPPAQEETVEPVAQFMTTYAIGDDLYDDSFSIDAPTGEFLGECGAGISEIIGVGEPKHVAAFEVWLFDKNDIQTVTKVVMSAHAHADNKIRLRLESKGEPILSEPGKRVLLETATLQLEVRIVDMAYGEGPAPDQSFFERLTLELSVWPKVRANF